MNSVTEILATADNSCAFIACANQQAGNLLNRFSVRFGPLKKHFVPVTVKAETVGSEIIRMLGELLQIPQRHFTDLYLNRRSSERVRLKEEEKVFSVLENFGFDLLTRTMTENQGIFLTFKLESCTEVMCCRYPIQLTLNYSTGRFSRDLIWGIKGITVENISENISSMTGTSSTAVQLFEEKERVPLTPARLFSYWSSGGELLLFTSPTIQPPL